VRIRVLGSAAGGGFPQWNCNCENCATWRSGALRATARTQSSVAVSADGVRWCLLNASPDLRAQVLSFPPLAPRDGRRGTAIAAILLTDAEIDHVGGLLSLRERQPLRLYCSAPVFEWVFRSNPVFGALVEPARFTWSRVDDRGTDAIRAMDEADLGLTYEACFVPGKVPTYVGPAPAGNGSNTAYKLIEPRTRKSIVYMPGVKQVNDAVAQFVDGCDCVLFDGTFWSEDEMAARGTGAMTASAMGHLPIGGTQGSLAQLRGLRAVRKIYTHINNTNPILDNQSPERRALEDAGWEVAEDGMDFEL
jgi:pyrroloquinoline quinone biosynthesis protein B